MLVEMVVSGLTVDPVNNGPVVVLKERAGTRLLPIWIGIMEASAIAFELERVDLQRPLTHDLLCHVVRQLGAQITHAAVVDLRDTTYFAELLLTRGEEKLQVDARPSDAIAIALRARAPIFCAEAVLAVAQAQHSERAESDTEPATESAGGPQPLMVNDQAQTKSWAEILENLDPEAFGKYKM